MMPMRAPAAAVVTASNQRRPRAAAGQALAEFAIIIPLLLLAVLGAVDIGRVVWASDTVANAAREGARWASVRGDSTLTPAATKQEIRDQTLEFLIAGGSSPMVSVCYSIPSYGASPPSVGCSGDVDQPGADNARGALVTVTVTTTVPLITGMLGGLGPYTVTSSSSVLVNN
jgi:Flp pilus assembly protein TadG